MIKKVFVASSLIASFAYASNLGLSQAEANISKFHDLYIAPKENEMNAIKEDNKFMKISDYEDKFAVEINKTADFLEKTDLKDSILDKKAKALKYNENNVTGIREMIDSNEFKQKFANYTDDILNNTKLKDEKLVLDKKDIEIIKKELASYQKVQKERIFIAISSSMPDIAIREYFKQLDGISGVEFVFRGIVGDDIRYIQPTLKYIRYLMKKNPNIKNDEDNLYRVDIQINPKVFRKYNIQKVPALIYIKNYDSSLEEAKPLEEANNTKEEVWIEYGLISPFYVLNKINKVAKSKWVNSILYKDSYFRNPSENKHNQANDIEDLKRNSQWNVK